MGRGDCARVFGRGVEVGRATKSASRRLHQERLQQLCIPKRFAICLGVGIARWLHPQYEDIALTQNFVANLDGLHWKFDFKSVSERKAGKGHQWLMLTCVQGEGGEVKR